MDDDPSHICGSLRVADLSHNPSFVALSYVWGSYAVTPHTITYNGCPVSVTENCWEALSHLRKDPDLKDPGRNDDGSIALWIDAICIDQSDEAEKARQIPLMGDIYSKATSVCIWLGKEDERTGRHKL